MLTNSFFARTSLSTNRLYIGTERKNVRVVSLALSVDLALGVWFYNLKISAEILDINLLETIAGKFIYEYQHVWKHKRILNHLILVSEGQFTLVLVRLWLNSTLHAFDTWRSTLDYIATVYLQAQQPDKGNGSWKHCVSNGATIAANRMSTFLRIQLMIENNKHVENNQWLHIWFLVKRLSFRPVLLHLHELEWVQKGRASFVVSAVHWRRIYVWLSESKRRQKECKSHIEIWLKSSLAES